MPERTWDVPEGSMVLTQSTIGSLELSPCRVTTIPKGFRTEPSVAMFQGTVMHDMIEGKLKHGGADNLGVREILTIAGALWGEEAHAEGKGWVAKLAEENLDPLDWAGEMHMLWQSWLTGPWALRYRDMELLEAEVPRHRQVGVTSRGTPLYLATGGIDAVFRDRLGIIRVVDWKTAGRPWSRGDGDGLIQDDAYIWLLDGEYGELEDIRFEFQVGSFSNMEWRSVETTNTCASIHNMLARVRGWADFLDLEDRPHLCTPLMMKKRGWWARPNYNHGHCHTCKFLGDEFDAEWAETPPAPLIRTENMA